MHKLIVKILKSRRSTFCYFILGLLGIIRFLTTYGCYNNCKHIPLEKLNDNLYFKVNPEIVMNKKEKCSFETIIHNTKSVPIKIIPEYYIDFSPIGIVNGSYSPDHCNPQFSVAILVTYRNRQSQLDIFIPYLHNFLRKQDIHYKIYVIEQQDEKPWNKGILYNVGAKQAIADKFPCLILHDVDLLPQDESNLYACLKQPRHMSGHIDKFRYVLTYNSLVGGVLAIRSDQYVEINGFSNRFFGWGGEDDDFAYKMEAHNLNTVRLPVQSSRYSMMLHRQEKINDDRYKVLQENEKIYTKDGYNSVKYEYISVKPHRLFTLIGIKL